MNALVVGNGSYIVWPCGHDLHGPTHTKLTLRKYVNARLLDQDGCFAKDIEYILGMQYAVEHKQVRDSVNIALRQTKGRQQLGKNIDAHMLKNPQHLQTIFKKDKAYTFLKKHQRQPTLLAKNVLQTISYDLHTRNTNLVSHIECS